MKAMAVANPFIDLVRRSELVEDEIGIPEEDHAACFLGFGECRGSGFLSCFAVLTCWIGWVLRWFRGISTWKGRFEFPGEAEGELILRFEEPVLMELARADRKVSPLVGASLGDLRAVVAVGNRNMLDLTEPEFHVCVSAFLCIRTCTCDHVGCHVDTDYFALLSDLFRSKETIKSAAAAEIQNCFAGLQSGYRLGIATTKTQIRAFRDIAHLLLAIP